MTDGHCATTSEVVFVDETVSSCPGATGSSTTPYCTLATGVEALTAVQHVLVVRGPMSDRLVLATSAVLPTVVGQSNAKGAASIPATNGTAIAVSSDTVLVRDLKVSLGSTSTSTGILVTGASTNVTLLRVTDSLTTGLGIDAEAGTTLTMNACTVNGNSAGGILLNGAAFDIEDTTVTGNGPGTSGAFNWGGILVENPPTGGSATINLATVETNNGGGVGCSSGVQGTGVLVGGNTNTPVQISAACGFSSCGTASPTCGAQ
jgi:hypothetical protein